MALVQHEAALAQWVTLVIWVSHVPAARWASAPWCALTACQYSPPGLWPEPSSSSIQPHASPAGPPAPRFQHAAFSCQFPAEAAELSTPCWSCSGTAHEPPSEPTTQKTLTDRVKDMFMRKDSTKRCWILSNPKLCSISNKKCLDQICLWILSVSVSIYVSSILLPITLFQHLHAYQFLKETAHSKIKKLSTFTPTWWCSKAVWPVFGTQMNQIIFLLSLQYLIFLLLCRCHWHRSSWVDGGLEFLQHRAAFWFLLSMHSVGQRLHWVRAVQQKKTTNKYLRNLFVDGWSNT